MKNRKIMFVADSRINKERKKTILSKRLSSVKSLILINPLKIKKTLHSKKCPIIFRNYNNIKF